MNSTLNDCNQICTNKMGSYECSCANGFTLQSDNTSCAGKSLHWNFSTLFLSLGDYFSLCITCINHFLFNRCQVSIGNDNCVHSEQFLNCGSRNFAFNRELKQPRQRRQQKPHKFAYLTMKTKVLHALHVHFSFLDISQTFSFFPWREMTAFAVVWSTWAYDDKCSIFSFYVRSAGSNWIPG